MHGSLCLANGILYVGRYAQTAHIQPYDLDGHALGAGFSYRGHDGARASVEGLAVDADHRIWVADGAGGALRSFNLFGQELPTISGVTRGDVDRAGVLGQPVDVATSGIEDEARLLVASGGRRRHALQLFHGGGERALSLRPEGNPLGLFHGLRGVALAGNLAFACEEGLQRVQVFREGEFHFLFRVAQASGIGQAGGARFQPQAIAALRDGRLLLAHGGAVASALLLLDGAGRLLRTLAEHGEQGGQVFEPTDVVVAEGDHERDTRVVVIDCDGDRVQVFTLAGKCYGSFADLPRVTS